VVGLIVARGLMFVNSLPSVAVRHAVTAGGPAEQAPLMVTDQARHESGPSRNVAADPRVSKVESVRLKSFDLPGETWQPCADSAQLDNAQHTRDDTWHVR